MTHDITAKDLTEAATGHIERTQLFGPQPIQRIMVELGADFEEVQACFAELGSLRGIPDEEEESAYFAGCVDGFLIGVRAQRAATERTRS